MACILDIFTDEKNGKFSDRKLWRHIAYGAATYVFLTKNITDEWWLATYLLVVAGENVILKLIDLKSRVRTEETHVDYHTTIPDESPSDDQDGGRSSRRGGRTANRVRSR